MDFGFRPCLPHAGTATALDAGKGRIREAVEAVTSRGAGVLHAAAGSGRMSMCAYLVEELLVDVNATDDSGGFFVSSPSPYLRKSRIQASRSNTISSVESRPRIGGTIGL